MAAERTPSAVLERLAAESRSVSFVLVGDMKIDGSELADLATSEVQRRIDQRGRASKTATTEAAGRTRDMLIGIVTIGVMLAVVAPILILLWRWALP